MIMRLVMNFLGFYHVINLKASLMYNLYKYDKVKIEEELGGGTRLQKAKKKQRKYHSEPISDQTLRTQKGGNQSKSYARLKHSLKSDQLYQYLKTRQPFKYSVIQMTKAT
jgi:hypothetical protein